MSVIDQVEHTKSLGVITNATLTGKTILNSM